MHIKAFRRSDALKAALGPLGDALAINAAPFKIVRHWPTIIVQCECDAKTILPLVGVNNPAQCPACEKFYAIAEAGRCKVGEVRMQVPD